MPGFPHIFHPAEQSSHVSDADVKKERRLLDEYYHVPPTADMLREDIYGDKFPKGLPMQQDRRVYHAGNGTGYHLGSNGKTEAAQQESGRDQNDPRNILSPTHASGLSPTHKARGSNHR